jgi:hypothetical protein
MVTLSHEQMSGPMEMLKAAILADIEEKLALKEEALWVKGQAELRKLQQEHKQLQSSVNDLRSEQDRLRMENRSMREAMGALSLSCEAVVKQVHLALRALPREPLCTSSPSAGSTMASEDGLCEASEDALSTPKSQVKGCSSAILSPTDLPSMRQESDCAPMRLSDSETGDALTAAFASPSSTPSRARSAIFVRISKDVGFTSLGIDVKQLKNETLRVKSVDVDGLVQQHNMKQASDASKIMVGDCITTVNGVGGDSDAMLAVCKQSSVLDFVLQRTSGEVFDADSDDETESTPMVANSSSLRKEAAVFMPFAQGDMLLQTLPPGL